MRYQCRTFESTYLFKVKSEDEISLKIFDLSQKCIDKKVFSTKALSLPVKELLAEGNFATVLEKLAQMGLLSKEHLVSDSKVTLETCEKVFDKTIEKWQQEDPIPSFSLFKKENPKLASTNLQSTCSGGAFSMKIGDGASDFEPSDDPIAAGAIGEEDGSKYDVPDPVS